MLLLRLRLRHICSAYDLVKTRLSQSEAEAEKLNQSQSVGTCIVIDLSFCFCFWLWQIWFSLDHKRNVSGGVVSRIGTLFSLNHKFYASDYDSDSDSVASENQPLVVVEFRFISNFLHTSWAVH